MCEEKRETIGTMIFMALIMLIALGVFASERLNSNHKVKDVVTVMTNQAIDSAEDLQGSVLEYLEGELK